MKKAIIIPVLFLQLAAFAQDLNPTVTVTNDYKGEASGIVKPAQKLDIPDSVSRFTLDFDYAVFENPYRGSYEFKPYSVQIRPGTDSFNDGKLYVKAGAGYTLHPDLHAVYTPFSGNNFSLSVFADHESHIGNYWNYKADGAGDITYLKDPSNKASQAGRVGNSALGARLRYSWGNAELDAVAAWDNIFSSISRGAQFGRLANVFEGGLSLNSIDSELDYSANLSIRAGADRYRWASASRTSATELKFEGSLGTLEAGIHGFSIGTDVSLQFLGGDANAVAGRIALIPRDVFHVDGWDVDLGLRLSALFSSDDTAAPLFGEAAHADMFTRKGQWIYPRIIVTRSLGKRFFLDAGITGGDNYASYWDFVQEHPFLGSHSIEGAFLDNTVEKLNIWVGPRGSITDNLGFSFKAGWRMVDNDLLWKAVDDGAGAADMLPHLGWCSHNQVYSALDLDWLWEPFSAKVGVEAGYTWLRSSESFFAPAILKGKSELNYHWGDRVRVGVRGSWQTSRKAVLGGNTLTVPGWCDLGLYGEFQLRRGLSLWLEASNLLNQAVMTDPFIAQRGISCTAGVIFRL